jgi:hypothetical protein
MALDVTTPPLQPFEKDGDTPRAAYSCASKKGPASPSGQALNAENIVTE